MVLARVTASATRPELAATSHLGAADHWRGPQDTTSAQENSWRQQISQKKKPKPKLIVFDPTVHIIYLKLTSSQNNSNHPDLPATQACTPSRHQPPKRIQTCSTLPRLWSRILRRSQLTATGVGVLGAAAQSRAAEMALCYACTQSSAQPQRAATPAQHPISQLKSRRALQPRAA